MPKAVQATIGFILVGSFFVIAGFVGYLLYGPGIKIEVPDFFWPTGVPRPDRPIVETSVPDPLANYAGVLFKCSDGRALKAEFGDASVNLSLSDGRTLILPQTISASGARYANTNESFVFWNKGNTAFVEEGGVTTYQNCATL